MEKFDDIKVGDRLILSRLWYDPQVVTVEKVTKATFTANGIVFNKDGGRQRGAHDSYSYWQVHTATEEQLSKVERDADTKRYANYLKKFDYSKLPLETLKKIYDLTKN